MRQMEQTTGLGGGERKRVEAVVETLAATGGRGDSLAEVAHDARNMVTALGLYCDLLEEPGVLTPPFHHYGNELRLVAAASRRLVEKLVSMDGRETSEDVSSMAGFQMARGNQAGRIAGGETAGRRNEYNPFERMRAEGPSRWDLMPATPIANLAGEVLANRNLLAALAGPAIALTVDAEGGAKPVRLTGEDLTRVLVNLVKNAAEAMPGGGRIQLGLREPGTTAGGAASLALTIEDNGRGIDEADIERIFEPGYTTSGKRAANGGWAGTHRGLGLSITRSIVEAAGGRILASNRAQGGARFEIELPVFVR